MRIEFSLSLGYTRRVTLDALIMLSGALIAVLPFLGFPLSWDNIFLVVLGVLVITLGIIVRRRGLNRTTAVTKANGTYMESSPPTNETHEA